MITNINPKYYEKSINTYNGRSDTDLVGIVMHKPNRP
jgi:hypothetical protein